MWFTFWIDRSTACVNLHGLLPVLKRLLQELWVSPKRKIKSTEDLKEAFDWEILDLIWIEQKEGISDTKIMRNRKIIIVGKKNHTKKNIVISDENKYIWYLWPTVSWKSHDYGMFKEKFNKEMDTFIQTNLLLDLWFLWVDSDYWDKIEWILVPKKKKRKTKDKPKPGLTKK